MKVTAILPDNLIQEVKRLSNGKNITDSLRIALEEWISLQKIKKLNKRIKQKPLDINVDPFEVREINRKS